MASARGSGDHAGSRESILVAALEAFDSRGFAAATMSDIRRQAGVSNGSLYHHFPGKQHLAAALFAEGVLDYQQGFVRILEAAADARTGVRGGVLFHLEWARGHRALARFVLGMLDAGVAEVAQTEVTAATRAFLRDVYGWLGEQVRQGQIRQLPRDLYYPVWIGPAQELVRQWIGGRTRTPIARAGEPLADTAWASLRAGSCS